MPFDDCGDIDINILNENIKVTNTKDLDKDAIIDVLPEELKKIMG